MNLYREAGELLLGSRLKRTGERFLSEISKVYRSLNIDFDPAWFPVFFLLNRNQAVTISQLAKELRITQSGATQLIISLEKRGLLEEFQEEGRDRRTKSVRFTDNGTLLLEEVRPVWTALDLSMKALFAENPEGNRLLPALSELEDGFKRIPLEERVIAEVKKQQQIKDFSIKRWSPALDQAFKEILLESLTDNTLSLQPEAEEVLKNPATAEGELLLLMLKDSVFGYGVLNSKPNASASALMLSRQWKHSGTERVFIEMLEETADTEIDLLLSSNQPAFISAAKDSGYKLVSWQEDTITLRRKK